MSYEEGQTLKRSNNDPRMERVLVLISSILTTLLFSLCTLTAYGINGSSQLKALPTKTPSSASMNSFSFYGRYSRTMEDWMTPDSSLGFSMTTPFIGSSKFILNQDWQYLQENDPGENPVQIQDTALKVFLPISRGTWSMNWNLILGTTIPISEYSKNNGIITQSSAALNLSPTALLPNVRFQTGPFIKYYFNQYTNDLNGRLLPQSVTGWTLQTGYDFNSIISISMGGGLTWIRTENRSYATQRLPRNNEENKSPPTDYGENNLADSSSYFLNSSLNLQLLKEFGLSFGYEHGSAIYRFNQLDLQVYDVTQSRFFVQTTLSF